MRLADIPRTSLANLPTPIVRPARLAASLGVDLWVKRDDMSGGPEAGNKIRKLEVLVADALAQGADTLITCGGVQSNHARATAVAAASQGLRCVLYLRVADPKALVPLEGNVLLDRLAGAEIRLWTEAEYADRDARMEQAAAEMRAAGARPYVIAEGGSNGRGALGYVLAMEEIRAQLDRGVAGGAPFDVVVHACGSGGTAAGVALGAARFAVAKEVRVMLAQYDVPTFEALIARIIAEARALAPELAEVAPMVLDDRAQGPAYAVSSPELRAFIARVGRESGLLLDPAYTGKAFHGLAMMAERGELEGKRVLFLHTGGLPGLLVQAATFAGIG